MTKQKFQADNLKTLKNTYSFDHPELDSLLKWLQAPPNLQQFEAVLKNLQRLFRVELSDLLRDEIGLNKQVQNQWQNLSSLLLEQFSQGITKELTDIKAASIRPERGLIGLFPVYAALTANGQSYPDDQVEKISYLQLVGLCCAIEYDHMQKQGIISRKSSGFETALRELRNIDTGEIDGIILPDLRGAQTVPELMEVMEDWIDKRQPHTTWGDGLRLLFESIIEKRDRQERNFRLTIKTQTKRSKQPIRIYNNQDDPNDQPAGPEVEFAHRTVRPRVAAKLLSDGLHPDEMGSVSSVLIKDDGASAAVSSDERLLRHRNVRSIQAAITRSAQHLPNDWANPSPYELAVLLRVANDRYSLLNELSHLTQHENTSVRVMVLLRLYTGRNLDTLKGIKIVKNKALYETLKNKPTAFLMEEKVLALPVSSHAKDHSFRTPHINALLHDAPFYHKNIRLRDIVFIRLPENAKETISAHAKSVTPLKIFKQVPLFKDSDAIPGNINSFLTAVNKRYSTRWTESKLGLYVRMAIDQCTSDQSILHMITNQELGHGIVSSYYLRISTDHVQSVIHNAQKFMEQWLQTGIKKTIEVAHEKRSLHRQNTIGSTLALPDLLVSELCQHLKHKIRLARKSYQGTSRIQDTHNALIAYMTVWLGFISGYRAVLDPISHPYEIDIDTGLMIISDKDNDLYQHTRIIPLTIRFTEQIKAYTEHLKQLAARLPHKKSLKESIYGLVYANSMAKTVTAKLDTPFLFFLSPSLQTKAVSPTHLRPYYPFPIKPNANRHYLRSKLLELGADSECISYFLGHWTNGEEPYQKNSSISWIDIAEETMPYIERLEQQAGWTVQRGLAHVE